MADVLPLTMPVVPPPTSPAGGGHQQKRCTILFFVHHPKTGGTSVETWLRDALNAGFAKGGNNTLTPRDLEGFLQAAEAGKPLPPPGPVTQSYVLHAACCSPLSRYRGHPGTTTGHPTLPHIIRRLVALRAAWDASEQASCRLRLATLLRDPPHVLLSWFTSFGGCRGCEMDARARFPDSAAGFTTYLERHAAQASRHVESGRGEASVHAALDLPLGFGMDPSTHFLVGDLLWGFRASALRAHRSYTSRAHLMTNATARAAISLLASFDVLETFEDGGVSRFVGRLAALLGHPHPPPVTTHGSSQSKTGHARLWYRNASLFTGGTLSLACKMVRADSIVYATVVALMQRDRERRRAHDSATMQRPGASSSRLAAK